MRSALTIAGFDPSGGAGVQADLKVFQSLGVYGLSVAAALTAQNSARVDAVIPVAPSFLKRQARVLLCDIMPDAVKTGLIFTEENVEAVADTISRFRLLNIVVDPVFLSSSGKSLARKGVPGAMKKKLLPLCHVITPNIHEASVLSGIPVHDLPSMEEAARRLRDFGPTHVIVTGGHLAAMAADVVFDGAVHVLKAKKRKGEFHGTGCTFSAAVTAFLAKGETVLSAARLAKEYMAVRLSRAFSTGKGMKLFA